MVTTRKHKRHTQELTFHRCFAAYLTYEMSLIFLFSDDFSVLLILFWWGHSTIFHNSRNFTLEFHKMKNLLVIFMHYQLFPFEWLLLWNRMPIFFLVFCTNPTKYCRLWFQMNKFECRINVLLSLLSLSYPIRKAFDGWFRFAAQFHYSVESISRFSYGTTEYRYFSFLSAQPKKKFNSQHQLDT